MRLSSGQNAKIDHINELVDRVQQLNDNSAMDSLLKLFHPLILKLCNTWARYFDDESHNLKPMDQLITDTQYWMWYYTKYKYIVNGPATYNNFIRKHLTQRIRFMFEQELKYRKNIIMPDPDKNDISGSNRETFDDVIYNYSSMVVHDSIDDKLIEKEMEDYIKSVANNIISLVNNKQLFNSRELDIFNECIYNSKTHTDMARELGISRTRVSQMISKIKAKIRTNISIEEDDVL